jgi:alpha-galactosidase
MTPPPLRRRAPTRASSLPAAARAAGALLAAAAGVAPAAALDNGLARTPPMGFNSWTAVGTGVSAQFLLEVAATLKANGLAAAGYEFVNTDDGWDVNSRDANGDLQADPAKFPGGIANLTDHLHGLGFKFGIYTAESSVVCSGRPGSLYAEARDAATFAAWGVE